MRLPPKAATGLVLPGSDDTIVAPATPPGRGALAVIRLSGADAHRIAARVIRPWRADPWRAYLARICDPETHALIDRAVVTPYSGPRSYTGEDLVELSVHGGALVPALVFAALVSAGAREALPGEFTRRAVAHGKMDVLQAEAVGDLIDAQSGAMYRAALEQLDGNLSRRISALREMLLNLEALVAYDIDFPEEDDGPVGLAQITATGQGVLDALDLLLSTASTGELIRSGARVVLAGAPNVGKSSLFNALVGQARAIVTDVPGTTRDAIEALVAIDQWPVRLVDTAGLRAPGDLVERLGIEASERHLRNADVVLACGDTPAALRAVVARVRELTAAPIIAVRTKADLASDGEEKSTALLDALGSSAAYVVDRRPNVSVSVSAVTGAGLGALGQAIVQRLTGVQLGWAEAAPLLTRERHRVAVARARAEVSEFISGWGMDAAPATVLAVHLRAAVGALESMIGAVDAEDVLDRLFQSFCVGK